VAKLLERRRSERFEVNAEFAELEPGSISFVNNLSESGVFVSTRTRLPLGTPLELRFTILLDDPVVISGTGRVVHHQDEPRGMGVSFVNLSAEMQLRVIDAIGWHRAREASRSADPGFRTRELTPDEMAQLDSEEPDADQSITSLSSAAVLDDSLTASRSGLGGLRRAPSEDSGDIPPPPPSRRAAPPPPAAAQPSQPAPARKPAPPPPPKDDEYEDF
jgi:hypothetical protein